MTPLDPFGDGRDSAGRFAKGNRGGPGNPHGKRVADLRRAMLDAVSDDDFAAIMRTLLEAAKAGEPWAVREALDRIVGRPIAATDDSPAADGQDRTFVVPPPRLLGQS